MSSTKLVPISKLEVRYDKNNYLEIEKSNFIYEHASHEEQVAITAKNDVFESEVLIPTLARTIMRSPCSCSEQGPRLQRRWNRTPKVNKTFEEQHPLSQHDFDQYYWGVLAQADHGVDEKILIIARRCECCGKVEIFQTENSDVDVVLNHIAHVFYQHIDSSEPRSNMGDLILEDVDTGEMIPAEDLKGVLPL